MEIIRFGFWEAVKVLALVLLGLISAKSVAALPADKKAIKPLLYLVILVLAGIGAWEAGNDVAAEVYRWSAASNLNRGDIEKAYSNALQAVTLRPGNLGYWQTLIQVKMRMQQLQSVLDDEPAVRSLSHGSLDEVNEYEFSLCRYFLGQYDQVIAAMLRLTRQNPSYAAPYVLEGLAYTAEQKYPEAQQSFLSVLQIFPNNQAAIEGLARAYYLSGDRQRAVGVLDETAKYPFPDPIRQRFEALKGLYDQ
jgi:tetratricopeptide (TPR) repeat protein